MKHTDDLAGLVDAATEFAVGSNMMIIPALPEHDLGPEVCLGPDELDLPGFLDLAEGLSSTALYLRALPFDPSTREAQTEGLPEHLAGHEGKIGEVGVAFMSNGLIHFWEHAAAWYVEWEELTDSASTRRGLGLDEDENEERLSEEQRERLAAELADVILADPAFRGARANERQQSARRALPKDANSWAGWDAVRMACTRAQEVAEEKYEQFEDRLDELAAELLASPDYQKASSSDARKRAAERFLMPYLDGSRPTPLIRNELYARAQHLAKAAKTSGKGLF